MKKGILQPEVEHMRMDVQPVAVALHYKDIQKDPFPTPQEAQVWFELDAGRRLAAFVPLDNVDEENKTVIATLLGEYQDHIVVSFPPTNFGQTRFTASEAELKQIAHDSDPTG